MRIADKAHAAESVAAVPKRIPGALRHPNIATSPQNVTAERIIRFACMVVCVCVSFVWFGLVWFMPCIEGRRLSQ